MGYTWFDSHSRNLSRRAFVLICLMLMPAVCLSRTPEQPRSNRPVVCRLKLEVNLVVIEVDVFDEEGKHVSGLHHEDFVIYDNGKKQAIQFFSNEKESETEDSPAMYRIGYYPPHDSQEGQYRSIRVRVRNSKRRGLTLGYYEIYYQVRKNDNGRSYDDEDTSCRQI